MDADRNRARRTRLALLLAAGAYLIFVVYGSLVPLDFHWIPREEAWARFRSIPYLELDIGSRADWVANILLFIPLSFLWLGASALRSRTGARVLASGAVWIASAALSVGIEYAQVYVPPRTVSLNDVLAETLGAGIGIVAWWVAGGRAMALLGRWRALRGGAVLAEWLLWPYILFLALYDLMPLDLTLSPYDLVAKWHSGMIELVPFSFAVTDAAQRTYGLVVEALLWLPLAALWYLAGRGGRLTAWAVAVLFSTGIEFAQLFVFTRVSAVTDILCAAAGGGAGVWLAGLMRGWQGGTRAPGGLSTPESFARRSALLGLALSVLWLLVLSVLFWYPYDFHVDVATARVRLRLFYEVPFASYYFGTEYRALTEVLHKVVFFAPLGIALAIASAAARRRFARALCVAGSMAMLAFAAVGIELGQVLLPIKYPSLTDAALEWLGGALGFWSVSALRSRLWPDRQIARPIAPGAHAPSTKFRVGAARAARAADWIPWVAAGVAYALFVLACLGAARSRTMPYNVRELFNQAPVFLVALLFPLPIFAAFMPPVQAARWLVAGGWSRSLLFPLAVVVHALFAWFAVRAIVPLESIGDIVGAPVLHWPWEWETAGRFVALFGAISTLLTGAALLAGILCGLPGSGRTSLRWLIVAVPLLGAAYLVVVVNAATDNLTELMRAGGGLSSSFWLAAWLVALAAGGSAIAMLPGRGTRRGTALLLAASSIPFGWMAVSLGTSPAIAKYGAVFSALQFLLSPDRSHYVVGSRLVARYVVAHAAGLAVLALTQMPIWIWSRGSGRR